MKNLKMFAIALLAMLVMVSGVRAATENPCKDATGKTNIYAKINGVGACYAKVSEVITAANTPATKAEEGSTVEMTIYVNPAAETGNLTLLEDVNFVIDLNGNDLALGANSIEVSSNQTLTIKGKGEITASATALSYGVGVDNAKVTVEKDVTITVTGTDVDAIVLQGANELTFAGKLDQNGTNSSDVSDAIVVTGGDESPVLNVSGDIDSANGNGIKVTGLATVNVTGGTIKATTGSQYAISLTATDEDELPTLKISGGEMTVARNGAAVGISGTDPIPKAILEANKGNVTGGKFNYGLVKGITVNGGTMTVADILAILIGNADYTIASNGTVTLTAKATQEPEPQQPGTTEPGTTGDGNQGGTDNVKNPETNDNILVYAGLGLVSLASVAFTAKKRED